MLTILLSLCLSAPVTVFQEKPLYQNPIAYVRSPEMGVALKQSRFYGKDVKYLEGQLGEQIAILDYDHTLQLGLEGGAWLMLGYDAGTFPMLTQDFYFSIPLYFKYEKFSAALKYNHISAHKGDGIDKVLEKYLSKTDKQKLDMFEQEEHLSINLVEPINYSRDFVSIDVAYDSNVGPLQSRRYIQVGYCNRMFPSYLKRWFFAQGGTVRYDTEYGSPYYAQDIRYNEDTDSVDYSSQLGIMSTGGMFEGRLALTGYIGSDRRGQFLGRKLKQIGIGIFIR